MTAHSHTFLSAFNSFTVYYIIVAVITLILLGLLIWSLLLNKSIARKYEKLQKRLDQQYKELQQFHNNPESGRESAHLIEPSSSGNNHEGDDTGDSVS